MLLLCDLNQRLTQLHRIVIAAPHGNVGGPMIGHISHLSLEKQIKICIISTLKLQIRMETYDFPLFYIPIIFPRQLDGSSGEISAPDRICKSMSTW